MDKYRDCFHILGELYPLSLLKTVSSYSERELIKTLIRESEILYGEKFYEDDGGVISLMESELIVSVDSYDEDVHFDFDICKRKLFHSVKPLTENEKRDPYLLLGKNLTHKFIIDLYAMGASPIAYTLDLALPPNMPIALLISLYRGIAIELKNITGDKVRLINGNIRYSHRALQISATVFGRKLGENTISMRSFLSKNFTDARLYLAGELGVSEYLRLRDLAILDKSNFKVDQHMILRPPYTTICHLLTDTQYSNDLLYICDLSDGLYSAFERIVACTRDKIDLSKINKVELYDRTAKGVERKLSNAQIDDMKRFWLHSGDNYAFLIISKRELPFPELQEIGTLQRSSKQYKMRDYRENSKLLSMDKDEKKIENFEFSEYIHLPY